MARHREMRYCTSSRLRRAIKTVLVNAGVKIELAVREHVRAFPGEYITIGNICLDHRL